MGTSVSVSESSTSSVSSVDKGLMHSSVQHLGACRNETRHPDAEPTHVGWGMGPHTYGIHNEACVDMCDPCTLGSMCVRGEGGGGANIVKAPWPPCTCGLQLNWAGGGGIFEFPTRCRSF